MPFLVTRTGTPELTYEQVRRLNAPTRGVRGSTEFMDELRAFSLVLPPKTVFSHITAACVQNLPLDVGTSRPYHVTTDSTGKRGKRKGLTWHQRALTEEEMDRWHGLPVTSPLRTWQDLAQSQTLTDLVVVADVLLRRKLCTPDQLRDVHGRRHKNLLLEAALKADGGSASPEETKFRLALYKQGLPPATLNDHIIDEGIWIGCGDFVWRQWRVIADYDGDHHKTPEQRKQDAETRDDYSAAGWRHVAVTNRMTRDQAVDRVKRALTERGWRP